LGEIVTYVRKRNLDAKLQDKVGLAKDVWIIPLNRGFVLCAKDVVLHADTVDPLYWLDGTHSLTELVGLPYMESALQQLSYYGLLCINSHNGSLKEIKINPQYATRYQNGNFVTFSMVPLAVEINITNTCNFACIHCSKDSKPVNFPNELSTEEIVGIIEECVQLGIPELRFMGGEPLAHPDFFKFVQHAKENGVFQLRLSTNGWVIDDARARELSKWFDTIQISVHGASEVTHDRIVGKKGAWVQARRATRLLVENGVKVNLGFTVMRQNAHELSDMSQIAIEWGANSLGFLCLVPQGRATRLKGWSTEEIFEIGDVIMELQSRLGSRLAFDVAGFPPLGSIKNDATVFGCEAGKTVMAIDPTGVVKSCGILQDDFKGQIRETNLLEIWHSPKFIEMRKQSSCEDCNYCQICWGQCRFLEQETLLSDRV